MITITKKLDMSPHGIPQVIHVSQYDSDFSIQFKLFVSVGELNIESGTTAEIRGTKRSGTGYNASATINVSNNTVTVAGDAQMTAVAGRNTFEIVLKKSGKVLGSANFVLLVERAALDADTITDASVLRELNAIVEGAETATQAAEEAEDAADRAEAAAQSLVTDPTLTHSGQAADAKVTGDKIGALKSNLNNLVLLDNRVVTDYDAETKTYSDTRVALTGTVVTGYTWNKSTGSQDINSNGKYARYNDIGQYETLYISGAAIDADHRLYAFYTANNTLISAQSGSGASGGVQVKVTVPENADYVVVNTMYSTGDSGRDIDPACSALKVGEQDIVENMLLAQGTVTEGYAWRPGQTPLQNSGCRYTRYNTVPDSDYIYVSGRAYRVSTPLISFYNSSDELISSYGANSLTYYEYVEMTVPSGTSYFIANGAGNTPYVKYPSSSSKKTQREVNAELYDIKNDLVSWLYGKKVSIIGDSIDTFDKAGYKIDGYRMFYPRNGVNDVNQTWWMQVINASGAELEVNASWSGSRVTNTVSGYPDFYDRVSLIGSPDLIFVTLGTNDASGHVSLGNYDFDTAYSQLSESEFRPAYIKGVKALQALYPNAVIVCAMEKMVNEDYKNSIIAISQTLGTIYIDLSDYTPVDTVHPGVVGMRQIARCMLYPTDKTLSQDKIPADAKTVGTELANIRTILDNIDPLSDAVKEALLKCFEYVYWSDDRGHDAYEELKEALMGEEYIYKLEEPLVVDGTTGYLVTDVAPFTEDRSFTIFIDYTEGGRDWTVSSVVADTIFQVRDFAANKSVIASTFKTANASNVTTRISVFGIQYAIRQAKENAGNRRIRYGVSYDAETGRYTAVISVNGTVIAPYEDHTDTEVSFAETDAVLNIGCNVELAEILKGTVNDLQILNHTTSQADLTAYVTSLD